MREGATSNDQFCAHGQEREIAIGAPKVAGYTLPHSYVTAQRDVHPDRRIWFYAPNAPCSTSDRIASEQEDAAEKRPDAKVWSDSGDSTDPGLTSLERRTIARRVANRQSANRSQQSMPQGRCDITQGEQPDASQHPGTILISSTRKPISYINDAKRFLSEHGEVHLTALGVAIGPMVTVAEILKGTQLAVVTRLHTSLEDATRNERLREKPKMDIVLSKSANFDAMINIEATKQQEDCHRN